MFKIIGIDIGTRFIKIVVLNSISPVNIDDIKKFDTPYTVVEKEEKVDKEKLIQLISETLSKDLPVSEIKTGLPSNLIKTIHLSLPKMSKKDLDEVVPREAEAQMVPSPPKNSIYKYLILESGEQVKLLVASTQKDNIDNIISLYKNIKIPSIISFNSFSHIKTLSLTQTDESEVGFIDIGANISTISVMKGNDLKISRNLHPLCSSLVSSISKKFNLTKEEAEESLIKYGIPQVGIDFNKDESFIKDHIQRKSKENLDQDKKEKVDPVQLRLIFQQNLKILIRGIKRTLLYYKERYQGGEVGRFLLSGGGASLKNVDKFLAINLDQEVEIFDPFKKVNIDKISDKLDDFPHSMFATALGLSLQTDAETINFLPKEYRKVYISKVIRQLGVIGLGIVSSIIFIVGIWSWRLEIAHTIQQQIYTKRQGMVYQLSPYLKKNQNITTEIRKLSGRISKINKLIESQPNWEQVLKQLPTLLPEKIVIKDLFIKKAGQGKGRGQRRGVMQTGMGKKQGPGYNQQTIVEGGRKYNQKISQQEGWNMELSGFIVANYRISRQILNKLESNFKSSPYFKIIFLVRPKLKKVSVTTTEKELTPEKKRAFKLKAKLIPVK